MMRLCALAFLATLSFIPTTLDAASYLRLGAVDGFAIEPFPSVNAELVDLLTGASLPKFPDSFVLNSGSSYVLVTGDSAADVIAAGLKTTGTTESTGGDFVAGAVSEPYRMRLESSENGFATIDSLQILVADDSDTNTAFNSLGMSSLVGRSVTIEIAGGVSNGGIWPVSFSNAPPSIPESYNIPFSFIADPSLPDMPTAVLPTAFLLPVIEAKVTVDGRTRRARMLVDTSMPVSCISPVLAAELGFDANGNGTVVDEAVGEVEIVRIGGIEQVPIVAGDAIKLLTGNNRDLQWTNPPLGVFTVPSGVDGVVGFDLLTAGWSAKANGDDNAADGYIDKVYLNLIDASAGLGELVVQVMPGAGQVVSVPALHNADNARDVNDDGIVTALDVLNVINYINAGNGGPYDEPSPDERISAPFVDVSGDYIVGALDVLQVINYINLQRTVATATHTGNAQPMLNKVVLVPEPPSVLLLWFAGAVIAGRLVAGACAS